jgi:hypothetical protein
LDVVIEQRLHLLPGRSVDNGGVLTGIGFLLVLDQSEVVSIAQNRIERSTEEVIATSASNIVLAKPILEAVHTAQAKELVEDRAHCVSFSLVDDELAILGRVYG